MLTKRIIPCLDIKDGRTVKGVHFEELRDAGDPVELAIRYCEEGADEIVFLDITATNEKRKTLSEFAKRVASNINIPFTVGGGITSVEDVSVLLNSGADKVSVNSAAIKDPALINELAHNFGSQCIVLGIDAKQTLKGIYKVFLNGGRVETEWNVLDWAKEGVKRGAGEILLTSMDADGTKKGFDVEITRLVSSAVNVPVIASGGAGKMEDFLEIFKEGHADAALAASVFHYKEIEIQKLKEYLISNNLLMRI